MTKGQAISLQKNDGGSLTAVRMGLGWQAAARRGLFGSRTREIDLDASAVLFADISGFTALSERLAAKGADGVEELTQILNAYFGRLIEVIVDHGGDVVKFAGDALLAFWPVRTQHDLPAAAPPLITRGRRFS